MTGHLRASLRTVYIDVLNRSRWELNKEGRSTGRRPSPSASPDTHRSPVDVGTLHAPGDVVQEKIAVDGLPHNSETETSTQQRGT